MRNMARDRFYITTPIYYASGKLHIGHAYTTIAADALARFHRYLGDDTYFLTGTDEHGLKIQRRAEAAGRSPQEFVDDFVTMIKDLWKLLHISYDDFIRTTEPRHERAVQRIFQRLYDQGDIYKAEYEGWYCTDCEAFYTETQATNMSYHCPDHDRPLERLREEGYFFRLSKYADRLLAHIESHPEFIQPQSRQNEMVSFIKQGLEDLCVSRTSFDWGIRVPFDPKHVIYVWVDALSNYITALGYGSDDPALFERYWPADVHLMGKEIVRFHAIIWPIILMALGLPLPRQVFGHGWLVLESGKMSKSRGNVVDPVELVARYGVDAVRYFVLREIPFGQDGFYSEPALITRYNADLANDLGNLLSRSTAMIERFTGGVVAGSSPAEDDGVLRDLAATVYEETTSHLRNLELSAALGSIMRLVGRANKYIDESAPWELAADPAKRKRLDTVLYNLAETQRIVALLLRPFMPTAPERMWAQLGLTGDIRQVPWQDAGRFGLFPAGTTVRRGEPLFMRIEDKESPAAGDGRTAGGGRAAGEGHATGEARGTGEAEAPPVPVGQVTIDEFRRLELRVGEIVEAAAVAGATRLLSLKVNIGDEVRDIVAGVAEHYRPEELIGQQVVLVANLAPAKIRGLTSNGMLLAASQGDQLALVAPVRRMPPGSKVK